MIRQYNKAKKELRKIKKNLKKTFPFLGRLSKARKQCWAWWYLFWGSADENLIVFKSHDGRDYGGMPRKIYESLLNDPQYEAYKFAWVFNSKGDFKFLNENDRTRIYSSGSKKGIRISEKAHYMVTNSELAFYQRLRKNQVLVFDPEEFYGTFLYLGKSSDEMEGLEPYNCTRVLKRANYILASTENNQKQVSKLCREVGNKKAEILSGATYLSEYFIEQGEERRIPGFEPPEGKKRILVSLSDRFVISSRFLRKIERKYGKDYAFFFRKKPIVTWKKSEKGYKLLARMEEENTNLLKEAILAQNELHLDRVYDMESSETFLTCPSRMSRKEVFAMSDVILTDKWSEVIEASILGKKVICTTDDGLSTDGIRRDALLKLKEEHPEILILDSTEIMEAIVNGKVKENTGIWSQVFPGANRNTGAGIPNRVIDMTLGVADGWFKGSLRKVPVVFDLMKKLNMLFYNFKSLKKEVSYQAKELIKKADVKLLYIYYTMTGVLRSKGINFGENAKLLYTYKNKYAGQRCFLIGNGPSLTISDLELLQGEITFGCNRVYKLFENTAWRPDYFCMIDALIAKYSSKELAENVECPLFTNINTRDLMEYKPKNLVFARNLGDNPYRVSENFEAYYVPSGATVMTFMLELAMYMGFKDIYLIGVDCTSSLVSNGHCAKGYVNPDLVQKDIERVRKRLNDPTLTAEQVAAYYYDQSTFSYKVLRDYAEGHGIHIYNATRGGMLEVYERRNLDEVVGKKDDAKQD